jgi:DNA-binding CsgD family transcriptional regulator
VQEDVMSTLTRPPLAEAPLGFTYSRVATIDAEHRVIRLANEAFCSLFELDRSQVVGLPLEVFYPSQADSDRIAAHAGPPLRATGHYADERTMQRMSGRLFWCGVTGRSITPDEPYAKSVWCFQDLSLQWTASDLSSRDREIAILTCEGRTAKEIARVLKLSPRTVEAYLARLKTKLDVRNIAELVARVRPAFSPSHGSPR